MTDICKVRAVVFLSGQAMLHDPLVSSEVLSSVTRVVALPPTAVHQGLLTESVQLARLRKSKGETGM